MPLDAGDIAEGQIGHRTDDQLAVLRPVKVVLGVEGHVGAALRTARETLGLAEDDIAQVTRVRAAHIAAIEAFNFDALPARPFVVGYVRAYAKALGLESEAVVSRFKAEAPKADGVLRAPGGVSYDAFASIRWLLIVAAAVTAAVILWNLSRRAEFSAAAPAQAPAPTAMPAAPAAGPAQLGAPPPTPPEATTPPVYQTPGLATVDAIPAAIVAGAAPAKDGRASSKAMAKAMATRLTDGLPGGAPFAPAGAVYGAAGSGIVLQARTSTSLIVRGPGGAIYFARVLGPGDAWRAPSIEGLTAEVGEPSSVEAFVGGASRGRLVQSQTPLAHLADP